MKTTRFPVSPEGGKWQETSVQTGRSKQEEREGSEEAVECSELGSVAC